jgi:AraC family transcriptional regulator
MQLQSTRLQHGQFIGELCKEIELPDFSIKEIADQSMGEIPRHTHEDAHFIFVISGRYLTSASDVTAPSKSSRLIFNPAGTTHRDRFDASGGRFMAVSLNPEMTRTQSQIDFIDRPVGFSGGQVSWLGWKLYNEFHSRDEVSALIMTGLVFEMFGHILRSRVSFARSVPPWLRLAHELIHDRFVQPLTIKEIAQAVGAHPAYLVRAFRNHYGMTIGEYVRKLRIEFACRQISVTCAPLSQIATMAGFYDQSHFTRTFKRVTGLTPNEYRSISRTHGLSDTSNSH